MRFAIRSIAAPWRAVLVFATALTLSISAGKAADYHAGDTGGSNAYAGTSTVAAWQTPAKFPEGWGVEANTVVDIAGDWKAFLATPVFSTGHLLTVSGRNTIKISDVVPSRATAEQPDPQRIVSSSSGNPKL